MYILKENGALPLGAKYIPGLGEVKADPGESGVIGRFGCCSVPKSITSR